MEYPFATPCRRRLCCLGSLGCIVVPRLKGLGLSRLPSDANWLTIRTTQTPCSKLRALLRLGPRYHTLFVAAGPDMQQVAELVAAGKLRPHVQAVMPLEQARWENIDMMGVQCGWCTCAGGDAC